MKTIIKFLEELGYEVDYNDYFHCIRATLRKTECDIYVKVTKTYVGYSVSVDTVLDNMAKSVSSYYYHDYKSVIAYLENNI